MQLALVHVSERGYLSWWPPGSDFLCKTALNVNVPGASAHESILRGTLERNSSSEGRKTASPAAAKTPYASGFEDAP
jgi:hypothetical protein